MIIDLYDLLIKAKNLKLKMQLINIIIIFYNIDNFFNFFLQIVLLLSQRKIKNIIKIFLLFR